jgi:hypothetical protein
MYITANIVVRDTGKVKESGRSTRAVATSGRASDQTGVQGAASRLPEREVSSHPPLSLPPKAAEKNVAIALGGNDGYGDLYHDVW